MPSKPVPSEDKALIVANELTAEELTALLQQHGWAEKSSGDSPLRMKLDGNMLTTPDGEVYVYNPAKPKVPACTVRIVKPPEEYFGIWVDDEAARAVGIPEIAGTFSKKYIHPDPTRRTWPSDDAFDALKAAGIKASWKGDMLLQVVPENGTLTGEEPIYVLTLSTTSLIDFKGASKSPASGSVSEFNFITKLSQFAMKDAPDPRLAVINALSSLTLGGVVAEVRIVRAENKELGRTWPVIVFDPIHIEPVDAGPALEAGDVEDEAAF
jgi:hypothetical protein